MPCSRAIYTTVWPFCCCLRIATICDSENRFAFIFLPFCEKLLGRLYFSTDHFWGKLTLFFFAGNVRTTVYRMIFQSVLTVTSVLFRRSKKLALAEIIEGCRRERPTAQKQLFEAYYSFGVNICLRYAGSREEAEEMFDDGFLRILNKISYYDPEQPFDAWFRTVMVHSAIDHYRRHKPTLTHTDIDEAYEVGEADQVLEQLAADEIMAVVQKLPPAYRTVFCLYVVDGYSHPEIAQILGIHEGTSRSNLAKARQKLQELLIDWTTTKAVNRRDYV